MPDLQNKIIEALTRCPLVPVLALSDLKWAPDLAVELLDAGVTVAEVVLRTPEAIDIMVLMKAAAPELIVGMGTVRTEADMRNSLDAGAEFLVTPATSPKLLSALPDAYVPVFPGAATPSEAMHLYDLGYEYQKFFPAESLGGVKTLKAWGAPLPNVTFMATGGINADKCRDYLALPNVNAIGGSFIVDKKTRTVNLPELA